MIASVVSGRCCCNLVFKRIGLYAFRNKEIEVRSLLPSPLKQGVVCMARSIHATQVGQAPHLRTPQVCSWDEDCLQELRFLLLEMGKD